MFKAIASYTITFFSVLTIIGAGFQPADAFNLTLESGGNTATYDDDNDFGFTDWQIGDDRLLTQTGWFYRQGNSGRVNALSTLREDKIGDRGNAATLNYRDTDFTLELNLALTNSGSTLAQTATVTNISDSTLDIELYSYQDLVASTGNGGDRVSIAPGSYTATQLGDLYTIVTTVEQIPAELPARYAEVDIIDFSEDTLYDKLLEPSGSNLPLDNDLGVVASNSDPVTAAYQWNYSLSDGESFQVATNSVAVPFDFSPSLGILLSGILAVGCYLQRRRKSGN